AGRNHPTRVTGETVERAVGADHAVPRGWPSGTALCHADRNDSRPGGPTVRNRANSAFALVAAVVTFGLVIALVFAAVTLIDKLQGPHVPSGWAYVEYAIDGDLSEDEQEAVAKSIVFRMHLGRAADA